MTASRIYKTLLLLLAFWSLHFWAPSGLVNAQSTRHYVDSTASGLNNGTSSSNAFVDLQSALAVATASDSIWVAKGTYFPGVGRSQSFSITDDLTLLGGFAGTESRPQERDYLSNLTILSGDIGTPGIVSDNSLHVISAISFINPSNISGFIIQGGYDDSGDGQGGSGLLALNSNLVIDHCVFRNNQSDFSGEAGGAIYGSNAILEFDYCEIKENISTGDQGGGMYADSGTYIFNNININLNVGADGAGLCLINSEVIINSGVIRENTCAGDGAGIYIANSQLNIDNILFDENEATRGGGIYVGPSVTDTVFIQKCNFKNNKGINEGGAISIGSGSNISFIEQCTFYSNYNDGISTLEKGGAIAAFAAFNCFNSVFAENLSAGDGGAIYVSGDGFLGNVTLSKNAANQGGAVWVQTGTCTIINSILWDNFAGLSAEMGGIGLLTITYSDIKGGYIGAGNIEADPLFKNPLSFEFIPSCSSSVIDSGTTAAYASVDLINNPRLYGTNTDMGAYEIQGIPGIINLIGDNTICPGDSTLLDVSISSGTPPIRININPSGTIPDYAPGTGISVNPTDTTTYQLIFATDQTGCGFTIGKDSAIINVSNGIIGANLAGPIQVCQGDSIVLAVTILGGEGPYNLELSGDIPPIESYVSGDPITIPADASGIITYSIISMSDVNDCGPIFAPPYDSISILVDTLPDVSFTGLMDGCTNDPNQLLTGNFDPAGIFSGEGLFFSGDSTYLAPRITSPGLHIISYSYTDGNGCTGLYTDSVFINPNPIASFGFILSPMCVNDTPFPIVPSPSGGGLTGTGVSFGIFDPALAGPGNHMLEYIYTAPSGCKDTVLDSVRVYPQPAVIIFGLDSTYCENDLPDTLLGLPIGGTFAMAASPSGVFDPSISGIGSHEVTYNYIDPVTSCSREDTGATTVFSSPVVSITGYPTAMLTSNPPATLTATPPGGTFSGPGILGDIFYPSVADSGVHTISYSYTNANGCTDIDFVVITVVPPGTGAISGAEPLYCPDDGMDTLSGFPPGGVFSGPGMVTNLFDPTLAGPGIHTIEYAYFDSLGILQTESIAIKVTSRPSDSLLGLSDFYCPESSPASLTGSPLGGIFSGSGIMGSSFNPMVAGPGTWIIEYAYTDVNGCMYALDDTTTVNPTPSATFSGLSAWFAAGGAPEPLTGTLAAGTEIFSGPGVVPGIPYTFDPGIAGPGIHELIYSFTDTNGCTGNDTALVEVVSGGTAVILGLSAEYCLDAPQDTLFAVPLGGTFIGPGISGIYFNPSIAGPGTHSIGYIYTDSLGSADSVFQAVIVHSLPGDSILGLSDSYCIDAENSILTGFPNPSGSFSGVGMSGNIFSPAAAGIGTFSITYSITDANGCFNDYLKDVTVNSNPAIPTIFGLDSLYCSGSVPDTLTGIPAGGIFIGGIAISGNLFFPSAASPGTFEISYVYSDSNGCSSRLDTNTTVIFTPLAAFSGLNPSYCEFGPGDTLSGIPSGGTFSGPGISGNIFTPPSTGTFDITYSSFDSAGCFISKTRSTIVHAIPGVILFGIDNGYCLSDDPIPTIGFPTGGFVTGPGIDSVGSGFEFSPSAAGLGAHTLEYFYIDPLTGCQNTDSHSVSIVPSPSAGFSFVPACAGESVTFTELSSAGTAGWTWLFGDSTASTDANPTHEYLDAGSYAVTLIISDSTGCEDRDTQNVVVGSRPDVNFQWMGECDGELTTFSPTGDSTGWASINWTFSGLTPSTDFSPSKSFPAPGRYAVNLNVTTIEGCTNAETRNFILWERINSSAFPYLEDFESGKGGWLAEDDSVSWEHGTPKGKKITDAYSGSNAWVTTLDSADNGGNYDLNEDSWLGSPCFDFSDLIHPMLRFRMIWFVDGFDGMVMQYTLDDGNSWTNLGDIGEGVSWFNAGPINAEPGEPFNPTQVGWTGGSGGEWMACRLKLDHLAGEPKVRFRFSLASDSSNVDEGYGIDDIFIGERTKIALIEQFTSSSNGDDVTANLDIQSLIDANPDEVLPVFWHIELPGASAQDKLFLDNSPDAASRSAFYSLNYPGWTVLDGDHHKDSTLLAPPTQLQIDSILLEDPKFTIQITPSESGGLLYLETRVQYNDPDETFSESVTLRNVILEELIDGISGINGEDTFRWVMKKIINDHPGRVISKTWSYGDTEIYRDTFDLSSISIYDLARIRVLGFIQQDLDQEVFQTTLSNPMLITGTEHEGGINVEESIVVFPNPFRDHITIQSKGSRLKQWLLLDISGKVMLQQSETEYQAQVNIGDIPDGIYFLRILSASGKKTVKKIMKRR